MKLYGISGLGADKRVFQYLTLNHELIPIDWIEPKDNESIENYSIRLAQIIDKDEKFGILGVSFGGLVAVEISKQLKPAITILISSAEMKRELRRIYKIVGYSKLIQWIPQQLFNPPKMIASWIFGAKNKKLLHQILDDTDFRFAKWAVNQLMTWTNETKLSNNVLKIGGTNDKLIPPKDDKTILIQQGEHFMIVDRAKEISRIINEEIKK